jgi:hypothetical protein
VIGDVGAAMNSAKESTNQKNEAAAEEITMPAEIDSKCNNNTTTPLLCLHFHQFICSTQQEN